MKNKRRQILLTALAGLLFYMLLVVLLYLVESPIEGSSIKSFGDAFWYSICTLTTVGYGDFTPVSTMGYVLGTVMLLLSLGIAVTLFGTAVSILAGETLPLFFLRFRRNRDWYYFADFGPEANQLAEDLVSKNPDAIIIFGEHRDAHEEETTYRCLFLNTPPRQIVEMKKGVGSRIKIFFMKENDIRNNTRAIDLEDMPVDVYARTSSGRDSLSKNVHFFHSQDCCAREYWRAAPLYKSDREVVLIGFGSYGHALLKRAILTNVFEPDQHVAYHIFGNSKKFQELHPYLDQVFAINAYAPNRDSLFFHENSWTVEREVLKRADRIIICDDDENLCWDTYWQLDRYYAVRGDIYLRTRTAVTGIRCIGTDEQIYTAQHILQIRLNEAAVIMNDLYRNSSDENSLTWEDLDDFLQQSKIAAADHLVNKIRLLLDEPNVLPLNSERYTRAYKVYKELEKDPIQLDSLRRIEHLRWLRFYLYSNWTQGPDRDTVMLQHPMVTDYDNLSEAEKATRDYSWELLGGMAEAVKKYSESGK